MKLINYSDFQYIKKYLNRTAKDIKGYSSQVLSLLRLNSKTNLKTKNRHYIECVSSSKKDSISYLTSKLDQSLSTINQLKYSLQFTIGLKDTKSNKALADLNRLEDLTRTTLDKVYIYLSKNSVNDFPEEINLIQTELKNKLIDLLKGKYSKLKLQHHTYSLNNSICYSTYYNFTNLVNKENYTLDYWINLSMLDKRLYLTFKDPVTLASDFNLGKPINKSSFHKELVNYLNLDNII